MADTLALKWLSSLSDYLKESFDDLIQLQHDLIAENVDNVIRKYSNSIKEVVEALKEGGKKSKTHAPAVLDKMREMMTKAWLVPTHGHQLGNSLCDALRVCDGLKMLISNCDSKDNDVKFSSIRLLEQCLTTDNRAYVVNNGLDRVVSVACKYSKESMSVEHSRISTGN